MMGKPPSIQRSLGRVEARVAELSSQIAGLRTELSGVVRTVEAAVASHRERINHLESFRRSFIGIISAVILSGAAAAFAYFLK